MNASVLIFIRSYAEFGIGLYPSRYNACISSTM